MKSKTRFAASLAALAIMASASSIAIASSGDIIDGGVKPLPGKPYQLHTYRVDQGFLSHDHYIYIVEDRLGNPISGAAMDVNVSQGKSSYNEAVSSAVAVAPKQTQKLAGVTIHITCESEAQCARILAATDKFK